MFYYLSSLQPFTSPQILQDFYRTRILQSQGKNFLYAIYDKLKHPGEMAGMVGLEDVSYTQGVAEIWVRLSPLLLTCS